MKNLLQETFLSLCVNTNRSLTVYLSNGVKLNGHITDWDDCTVALSRDGRVQLIMKHAISTIMPENLGTQELHENLAHKQEIYHGRNDDS